MNYFILGISFNNWSCFVCDIVICKINIDKWSWVKSTSTQKTFCNYAGINCLFNCIVFIIHNHFWVIIFICEISELSWTNTADAICVSISANLWNAEGLPIEGICRCIIACNHLFTQRAVGNFIAWQLFTFVFYFQHHQHFCVQVLWQ